MPFQPAANDAQKPTSIIITSVASTGSRLRRFLAIFTSNDRLILVSHSSFRPPYIRILPWFEENLKKIVTMEFSPRGEWLLVVTADATIYIIPSSSFLDLGQRKTDLLLSLCVELTA